MGTAIRVLLVDDSTFLRHTLAKRLQADPEIAIVGAAVDGLDAVAKTQELRPDVVVLDVEMPRMDGLAALKEIMAACPTPVVMFSAHTQYGARATIQALMYGAVDFCPKPAYGSAPEAVAELAAKIKAAASVSPPTALAPAVSTSKAQDKMGLRPLHRQDHLIVIGASTGGPRALQWILPALPAGLPAAIAVVQHMPRGFTQSLAARLNENSALTVEEAVTGRVLERGLVLVAPGDWHLCFSSDGCAVLDNGPRRNHVRPSVDVTMESAAGVYGAAVIGVVLTGMGNDGAAGAARIRATGGKVLAEHESSSIIYGMPRSVIEAGQADQVVPLSEIAAALTELVQHG